MAGAFAMKLIIFALILRDTLYFKVDDGNRPAYEAEGLAPFTYEARGRTVRVGVVKLRA